MQFLIFIAALVVTFVVTIAAFVGVVLIGSGAFGKPRMSRGDWAIVCVVAAVVVLCGTYNFGAPAFAGGMGGLAAFHYFYKRYLRTR